MRQLGYPTWNVELSRQQILDCIQDSLSIFSQYVPLIRAGSFVLTSGKSRYLEGVDVGLGIASVSFVDVLPAPTEIFYGNLIHPAPLFRTGLDDYDMFLRWRKTWMRVTSIQPDWFYDEYEKVLLIHNPLERYHAGVTCYMPYNSTESLPANGADWVKQYATAKARYLLGEIWMKFSGAIPGPAQNIQLDQQKRTEASATLDKLMENLKGQQRTTGIYID